MRHLDVRRDLVERVNLTREASACLIAQHIRAAVDRKDTRGLDDTVSHASPASEVHGQLRSIQRRA